MIYILSLSICLQLCMLGARAQSSATDTAVNQSKASDAVTVDDRIYSFDKVETEASFPGGMPGWIAFLKENLRTNIARKNNAPAGKYRVMARFIVNKDGSLSEIEAESNVGYGMEEEVIRVLKKSPRWEPAVQNGRNVRAYRRQPIIFVAE